MLSSSKKVKVLSSSKSTDISAALHRKCPCCRSRGVFWPGLIGGFAWSTVSCRKCGSRIRLSVMALLLYSPLAVGILLLALWVSFAKMTATPLAAAMIVYIVVQAALPLVAVQESRRSKRSSASRKSS